MARLVTVSSLRRISVPGDRGEAGGRGAWLVVGVWAVCGGLLQHSLLCNFLATLMRYSCQVPPDHHLPCPGQPCPRQ